MSLMMVSFVFVMIMIAEASTDRIKEVLNEVPEMQNQPNAQKTVKMGILTLTMWTSAMLEKGKPFLKGCEPAY